jgi:hypothetical protein
MSRLFRNLMMILFVGVILLLAGCGGNLDQTVTLYPNEGWETRIELEIPTELLAFVGSPAEVEAEMERQAAIWREEGARVSWKSRNEDGKVIYAFDVKGEGYDLLNWVAFDGNATFRTVEMSGRRQIQFQHFASRGLFSDLEGYTLTLVGGEIISSNGQQLNQGTVQWVNPMGRMEAALTEKNRTVSGVIWLLLIGLVAGGGGWYVWRRQRRSAVACGACGAWLAPEAQFCPQCGQRRTH